MEFYDVRHREKVNVPESDVRKTSYTRTTKNGSTQTRYAVRAKAKVKEVEVSLTKFISKAEFDRLNVVEEKLAIPGMIPPRIKRSLRWP